jgi:hexosaminidase
MQYWGDIVLEKPELIPQLPNDAVGLVWGYEVIKIEL